MVQEKGKLFETYNVGGHNEKQNIEIIKIILETFILHPIFMLKEPLDRTPDTIFEHRFRLPPDFFADLIGRDGITSVMSF